MVLHGLPVDGLILSHLCGPACELRAAEVIPFPSPLAIAAAELRCPSRLCRCSFAGVSNRKVQPWYVHVYVPVSAVVAAGFLLSVPSGAYSLLLDSIEVKVAGKSSLTLERLLGCLRD
jgi:hypothetical protein